MCNLGNIGHSFLIEGIHVMNPQTCYYLLLAAKAGNLQGCRLKNRLQRSWLICCVSCPSFNPCTGLQCHHFSPSQRNHILYPLQQDKQLTENWWFSVMFISPAFLHIDQDKPNALCCKLHNQQHVHCCHVHWHVFCKLWCKETCRYCVRTATPYTVCKLVCSKLLNAAILNLWERSWLSAHVHPADIPGGSIWAGSRDATCWGSPSGLCHSQLCTKAVSY